MVSKRAQQGLQNPYQSELFNELFATDPYHHESNPSGYIKLSSADNILPADLVQERIASIDWSKYDSKELSFYPTIGGEMSTRESVAKFVNKFCFKNRLDHVVTSENLKMSMKKHLRHVLLWIYDKNNQIKGDDAVEEIREVYGHDSIGRMTVFRWLKKFRNGDKNVDDLEDDPRSGRPSKFNEKCLTAAGDLVAQTIFDENDAMLTPAPYYYRYSNDYADRGLIHVVGVPTITEGSTTPKLDVNKFEEAYQETMKSGHPVKAILLVNPTNPEGLYYTLEELRPVVEWAYGHDLYIILDEIFDLTVYDPIPGQPYQSVLALVKNLGLSYDKIIWLWGLSKNFSMPGLRVGVVFSTNKDVKNCIKRFLMHKHPNSPTQFLIREFLDDHAWIEKFIPENHRRLKSARDHVLAILDKHKIPYILPRAGFFVMLDLRKYLEEPTFEAEARLQDKFLANNVFLITGKGSYSPVPGLFRLVFCHGHREEVEEGLRRVVRALGCQSE